MSRAKRRQSDRQYKQDGLETRNPRSVSQKKLHARERPERLFAMNETQGLYLSAIDDGTIIFGAGSAGTGKTYIATIRACELLYEGFINQVVLTRPNVETGKSLGALPGTLDEKLEPYMASMKSCITSRFSKGWLESQIKNENIICAPLNMIQGMTFDNSVVIVDEAEHLSKREMYIILTRIGTDSKMILCGDNYQKFTNCDAGFTDAMYRLKGIEGVYVVEFTSDDVVRSKMCQQIIKAYEVI
jgi:phosphate starvation-inducible PhoH-like protein